MHPITGNNDTFGIFLLLWVYKCSFQSRAMLAILALASVTPWLTQRLDPHQLEVAEFPGTGRGLRTMRDRASGEVLVSVEDADVVLAERVLQRHAELAKAAERAHGAARPLTDESILACHVCKERASQSSYAVTLPAVQPSGVTLAAAEAEQWLPRCYARAAMMTRGYAVAAHRMCADALGSSAPALDDFLGAFAHVRARSVEVSAPDLRSVPTPLFTSTRGVHR